MKPFTYVAAATVFTLAACHNNNANNAGGNMATATNAAAMNTAMANGTMSNGMMDNNMMSSTGAIDAAFVTDAIKGDNTEIAIGQLAESKGSTKAARDFGNMLVTDHSAHKQKVAALAASANIPVPDQPSDEGKASLDKLNGLSGAAFDSALKQISIENHTKDIAKYEKEATSGDAKTAAMAKDTLPVLRKHLAMAKSL